MIERHRILARSASEVGETLNQRLELVPNRDGELVELASELLVLLRQLGDLGR